MVLPNKFGITDQEKLLGIEEKSGKLKAKAGFSEKVLDTFDVGSYQGLAEIHSYLFGEVYSFAGTIRNEEITKGAFLFIPVVNIPKALKEVDAMPHNSFDEIVAKYVEMNVAHPFLEGNGQAMRLWLDLLCKNKLGKVVNWSVIKREDYLAAMEKSIVDDTALKTLLAKCLTDRIDDFELFLSNIDASFKYEGQAQYKSAEIKNQ